MVTTLPGRVEELMVESSRAAFAPATVPTGPRERVTRSSLLKPGEPCADDRHAYAPGRAFCQRSLVALRRRDTFLRSSRRRGDRRAHPPRHALSPGIPPGVIRSRSSIPFRQREVAHAAWRRGDPRQRLGDGTLFFRSFDHGADLVVHRDQVSVGAFGLLIAR